MFRKMLQKAWRVCFFKKSGNDVCLSSDISGVTRKLSSLSSFLFLISEHINEIIGQLLKCLEEDYNLMG